MPSWKKLITSGSDANLNSLYVKNSVTASVFSGSFVGDGSGLTNISVDIGELASFSQPFTNVNTVTVFHLLNTEYPLVQVYDDNDEQIIPNKIKVIDSSTVRVDFTENVSGNIVVAKGGHIISGSAANSILLDGQSGTYYLDYNNFTNIPQGIVSSSTQLTSSYDERYILSGSVSQADWNTLENRPVGIVSGAAQIVPLLPIGTVSGSSQVVGILSSLNTYTSSNDTTNTNQNNRLTSLETVSGSSIGRLNNLETFSGSVNTKFSTLATYTGSNDTLNTTQNNRLDALSTFTGSAIGRLNNLESFTSSINTTIKTQLNANTVVSGSSQINITQTQNYNGVVQTTGDQTICGNKTFNNNVIISGDLSVNGTVNYTNTCNFNVGDNIIELNYGGSATVGGIYVKDASGTLTSGSLLWNSSTDRWIAGASGSESNILLANGFGVVSGSSQIDATQTTNFTTGVKTQLNSNTVISGSSQVSYTGLSNIPTGIVSGSAQITPLLPTGTVSGSSQVVGILSSLNSYTSSNDTLNTTQNNRLTSLETVSGSSIGRLNNLETFSGSVNTKFNTLATYTGSVDISLSSLNIFTGSAGGRLNNLETFSGSVNTKFSTLSTYTGSNDTTNTTQNSRLDQLSTASGSAIGRLNNLETFSGSVNTKFSTLATYTGSVDSKFSTLATYTGSNDTTNTTQNSRLDQLSTASGSAIGRLNNLESFSGSVNTKFSTLATYTGSVNTSISSLNTFTGSISTTIKTQLNSNTVVSGSSQLTGSYDLRYTLSGSVSGGASTIQTSGSTIYSTNPAAGPNFGTDNNIILGDAAGFNSVCSQFSNFIGYNSGYNVSLSSQYSNFIGYAAGYNSTNVDSVVFLGESSGEGSCNSSYSNFIGRLSGYGSVNSSNSNFIGNRVGDNTNGACYSNLFGFDTGRTPNSEFSIGRNNIIIGTNITLGCGQNDSINLGGIIFATGSYFNVDNDPFSGSVGNGKVGINVSNPQYALQVSGAVSASAFYGDGSGLTGIQFDIGDAASYSQPFTNQTTFTVNHLLNSQYPFVQVYESGSNEQIIPLTVKVLDSSSVQISFTENVSGYVVVAKGGHIIQGTAENSNLLDGNPSSYYLDYNNFTNVPSSSTSDFTQLTNVPSGLVSGSSQLTSSYDDRYILSGSVSQADWNTLQNKPSGIISGSSQIVPLLPTGTVSGSSQIDASQTTNWTTNVKNRLNAETVVSSSLQVTGILTSLNTFTSSAQTRLNSLEITTQSLNQRLSSFESVSSSYARTDVNNGFSGTQTFNNISVNGTASFAYIESVTGSAKIIGDAFIVLNVSVPAERFGGLQVVDSGSGFTTSSFVYDGLNNNWVFQHQGTEDSGSSVAIFGPLSQGGLGTEVGLTENRIPKAVTDHGHHISDSNITDTGTLITLGSNTVITGTIVASGTTLISGSSQVSYTGLSNIPAGIVSGAAQITPLLPTGIVSGSSQVSYTGLSNIPSGIVSGAAQITPLLPTGTISGSSQVQFLSISGRPAGLVSGSSQVTYSGLSGIPSGIVSGSTQITPLLPTGTVSGSAQLTSTFSQLKPRTVEVASTGSVAPNVDIVDMVIITAQAATLTLNAPTTSTSITNGQKLTYRIKDNGTARSLSYNGVFRAFGSALPTTTTISKTLYLGAIYNSNDTKWDVVAVSTEV
jgi:hypothetical protein